jgi:hypothetical protein
MHVTRFVPVVLVLVAALAQAEDRADLDPTQVIGSRELPKVLYIVPWKPPLTGDLVGRPVQSLLDEALAPVDRDVFRRQVQYHATTESMSSAKTATTAEKASRK